MCVKWLTYQVKACQSKRRCVRSHKFHKMTRVSWFSCHEFSTSLFLTWFQFSSLVVSLTFSMQTISNRRRYSLGTKSSLKRKTNDEPWGASFFFSHSHCSLPVVASIRVSYVPHIGMGLLTIVVNSRWWLLGWVDWARTLQPTKTVVVLRPCSHHHHTAPFLKIGWAAISPTNILRRIRP